MAKFTFKLQPLLNVKLQMEDNLKNELGKAVRRLENEKDILKGIEYEREDYINQINSKSSGGILVEKLKEYSRYVSHLREKIALQKENVNLAQLNVDNYREQLIKVVQEREMLEKLKESKYQEFLKEQLKEEQRINDGVISFSYNTKLTGEKDG